MPEDIKNTIVALDTHSKVIYALHNFFTPISLWFAIICKLVESDEEMFRVMGDTFIFPVIISLILLICGIVSYQNFIKVDEKNLYICKKKGADTEVLKRIARENIQDVVCGLRGISVIMLNNKKFKLINCAPSILLIILTLPIASIPFVMKRENKGSGLLARTKALLDIDSEQNYAKAENIRKNEKGINITCWIILAILIFFGLVGLFYGMLFGLFNLISA